MDEMPTTIALIRKFAIALWRAAWPRHWQTLLLTFIVPAIIDGTKTLIETHLGLLQPSLTARFMEAIVTTYVEVLLAVVAFVFVGAAWRVWREQEERIRTERNSLLKEREEHCATIDALRREHNDEIRPLRQRIDMLEGQPDVTLEIAKAPPMPSADGDVEELVFRLRNYGSAAVQVRVEEFIAEEWAVTNDEGIPLISYPRAHLVFPQTIDVPPNGTETVEAFVRYDLSYASTTHKGVVQAFGKAAKEEHASRLRPATSARVESHLTYWNLAKSRRWLRAETLVFEGVEVHVAHGERREIEPKEGAPEKVRVAERSLPELIVVEAVEGRVEWVAEDGAGGYVELDMNDPTEAEFTGSIRALVTAFRVDTPAQVKALARIDYVTRFAKKALSVDYGCWLGERLNPPELRYGDTKLLMVAVIDDGKAFAVNDTRRGIENRHVVPRPLPEDTIRAYITIKVLDQNLQPVAGVSDTKCAVDLELGGDGKEPRIELATTFPFKE